nr:MAG TPA: hypothetical protein [Caudoviricetes sp.]
MDKTTSIGYCSSPYSPQPHNGIKLVSSANIPAKENKAQIRQHEKQLDELYKLYCFLNESKQENVSLQFRGNYIEINGTFNVSNEEFENYLDQMEENKL